MRPEHWLGQGCAFKERWRKRRPTTEGERDDGDRSQKQNGRRLGEWRPFYFVSLRLCEP
jgi:hypothetical protein